MSIKTCPNCFESMNYLVRTHKLTFKTVQQSQRRTGYTHHHLQAAFPAVNSTKKGENCLQQRL